jgi:3-deoxy-7-phosphoheptulonate synthase
MRAVENVNVREMTPLLSPRELKGLLPADDAVHSTVFEAREAIKRVLRRQDDRVVVVVGPCSIHDPQAALDYAGRLAVLAQQLRSRLLIVMRTYLEKPRTTTGWRGLINDPHIDGSFDMAAGLRLARELLLHINALGLPTACEMLDPISPQYIDDLVSFGAIGARTTESQTHRAMASGLSMPIGFKNSTDGSVQVAINAVTSMRSPHSFLGIDNGGASCVVRTRGNADGLIILRGSRSGPNYDAQSVQAAAAAMQQADLPPAVMVDCSHANSGSDHTRQEGVWNAVLEQYLGGNSALVGLMVESNLYDGKQPIPKDLAQLHYGVSITDACVGWETTERMLIGAYELLGR